MHDVDHSGMLQSSSKVILRLKTPTKLLLLPIRPELKFAATRSFRYVK